MSVTRAENEALQLALRLFPRGYVVCSIQRSRASKSQSCREPQVNGGSCHSPIVWSMVMQDAVQGSTMGELNSSDKDKGENLRFMVDICHSGVTDMVCQNVPSEAVRAVSRTF